MRAEVLSNISFTKSSGLEKGVDLVTAFTVLPFADLFLTLFSSTGCLIDFPIRRGEKRISSIRKEYTNSKDDEKM